MSDDASRLIIGWTCDDCNETLGDDTRMHDLVEQLRKEHEEETGHTTTVEVIEEGRILPSMTDRMAIGESMIEIFDAEIDWICPECHRSGEDLEATKRCPDCNEPLREVLPDGGTDEGGTERDENFQNPYLAASILPPGRRQLEALSQFLKEEQYRLHDRLNEMENDDGSIPDEATDEWSMVKGKLDQTRLFHGLIVHGILTDEMDQGRR